MNKSIDSALVWLRRDLRADDNAALYHALRAARRVWCGFVFDRDILDRVAIVPGGIVHQYPDVAEPGLHRLDCRTQ